MLASLLVLAADAGEEASGLGLVLPATAELIWGAVGFFLLLAILWRKVFPALGKALDERSARIQGQMEEAERERQQAEQLRRQYEEQLADARNEAGRIVEDARAQAERVRADIVSRAEAEAEQILARAREDAQADRGRMVSDLRQQVAVLSVDLASKIVQRELDPRQHQQLVDQYINELSSLS